MRKIKENRERCRFNVIEKRTNGGVDLGEKPASFFRCCSLFEPPEAMANLVGRSSSRYQQGQPGAPPMPAPSPAKPTCSMGAESIVPPRSPSPAAQHEREQGRGAATSNCDD